MVHLHNLDYYAAKQPDFNSNLTVIRKLHTVAEMLVLCKIFLDLPEQQLGMFARYTVREQFR